MLERDAIHISQLEINARVGVPELERAKAQRVVVSITLWPNQSFDSLGDDLAATIDYAAVAKAVHAFVTPRCDKLIETLAASLAAHLLETFAISAVRIELRKFVLPKTDHVAVIVTRTRGDLA